MRLQNSLDLQNEKMILEDINKLRSNRTILIVSHRLDLFKYCDRITSIKEGNIEIFDNHKDLN